MRARKIATDIVLKAPECEEIFHLAFIMTGYHTLHLLDSIISSDLNAETKALSGSATHMDATKDS